MPRKCRDLGAFAAYPNPGMMCARCISARCSHELMISLIQRVSSASVAVDGAIVGSIGRGLLVFLAVQPDDSEESLQRMVERVLTYRVFPDASDRMNRSLLDESLEILVVPQFTLAADTRKGTRASFTRAAPPEKAERYFQRFLLVSKERLAAVESGVFGANMKVSLENDGPVTFWLEA